MRLKIANACLDDMVHWFSQGGQVGILDGSNTTAERRQDLVDRFKACNVQPMFIETICDNPAIVDANIRSVKVSSPDVSHPSLCHEYYTLCPWTTTQFEEEI
jgi:6-phosphofructo-2-kinase/fructose-2,6-biphosphatase 4